jgi:hypothetical protein
MEKDITRRAENMGWENDRERYKLEAAIYSGPFTLSNFDKRARKDESVPKRPMSAFLDFSKTLHSLAIRDNPEVTDNKEKKRFLAECGRMLLKRKNSQSLPKSSSYEQNTMKISRNGEKRGMSRPSRSTPKE